jgi:hypothetical protein
MFDPCMVSLSNHQSPRSNVLGKYASARRFFACLASEIFLSSLQAKFINQDDKADWPRDSAERARPGG